MHKGFKCLDPKEARVYISRDVMFDESIFPFASLHPNAGARLRSELALLPDVLKNPSSDFRDAKLHHQHLLSPASNNALPKSGDVFAETGKDAAQNYHESVDADRHFMCPLPESCPPLDVDLAMVGSGSTDGSVSASGGLHLPGVSPSSPRDARGRSSGSSTMTPSEIAVATPPSEPHGDLVDRGTEPAA